MTFQRDQKSGLYATCINIHIRVYYTHCAPTCIDENVPRQGPWIPSCFAKSPGNPCTHTKYSFPLPWALEPLKPWSKLSNTQLRTPRALEHLHAHVKGPKIPPIRVQSSVNSIAPANNLGTNVSPCKRAHKPYYFCPRPWSKLSNTQLRTPRALEPVSPCRL